MVRISTDGSLVAAVGGRPGYVFGQGGVSVHLLDGATGRLLARYHRDDHRRIQRMDIIAEVVPNADGSLVAVATWGRDRHHPEAFVLCRASGSPLWELGTPGSARTIDLQGSRLIVGTKGCHANVGRGDGEVYAADLGTVVAKIPPNLTEASVHPWYASAGTQVALTARVSDADGVASVVARVESPRDCVIAHVALADDGQHGDGQENDGLWGACWSTEPRPADYSVTFITTDGCGTPGTFENTANFTTKPSPWITVESVIPENSEWCQGRNAFGLRLKNRGDRDARQLRAQVAVNGSEVAWRTDDELNSLELAAIAPDETVDPPTSSFAVHLREKLPTAGSLHIAILITDEEQHRWIKNVSISR